MLTDFTPVSDNAAAIVMPDGVARASNVPFVEMPMSLMPGIAGNCWKNPSTSRRVSGSPPVIRTFDTPSPAAIRIRRSVSS